jgi:hypothetical protein
MELRESQPDKVLPRTQWYRGRHGFYKAGGFVSHIFPSTSDHMDGHTVNYRVDSIGVNCTPRPLYAAAW